MSDADQQNSYDDERRARSSPLGYPLVCSLWLQLIFCNQEDSRWIRRLELYRVNLDKEKPGASNPKGFRPLFLYPVNEIELLKNKPTREMKKGKARVRTMTVLFSELLVPGWAEGEDAKIGLDAVTGIYGDEQAFTLPCHNSNPEVFFSEKSDEIALAKTLCGGCPVKRECLKGALSRQEPCGVWGGELFEEGKVIAQKRMPGRPRLNRELIGA